jgi:hypothetical protein
VSISFADVAEALSGLSPAEVAAQVSAAKAVVGHRRFKPLPGPQTDAYFSQADILLYGGSAGSAKSALLVGLAANEHDRSIIFRRESSQTDGLIAFGKEVIGDSARFNGQDLEWNWPDGRSLKLAGMQLADDWRKHAGRERDFIGFDEGAEFLEAQVSSIMAWLRAEPGKRCRVALASNPPRGNDGAWLVEWFAPWLDPQFPRPAQSGELRWAVMAGGVTVWVDGPGEHVIDGETYLAMSRTFIPAALSDNPYRNTPEYRARLMSLQEPLRSQLLYGDFNAGKMDGDWQVIPTAWVVAAQQRWRPTPPVGVPMCCIGVDVAQGGADDTALAPRYDSWFAPIEVVPGVDTPGGTEVAGLVVSKRRNNAMVVIDVGGGWGGSAHGHLRGNDIESIPYMGVKVSHNRTSDNQLKFSNMRTEVHWRFREALDPDQPGGSSICLPPDRELLADLTAPIYAVKNGGVIEVEAKDKLVKRLGRSPNRGDAVLMAWHSGAKMASHYQEWNLGAAGIGRRAQPNVILGHQAVRRNR